MLGLSDARGGAFGAGGGTVSPLDEIGPAGDQPRPWTDPDFDRAYDRWLEGQLAETDAELAKPCLLAGTRDGLVRRRRLLLALERSRREERGLPAECTPPSVHEADAMPLPGIARVPRRRQVGPQCPQRPSWRRRTADAATQGAILAGLALALAVVGLAAVGFCLAALRGFGVPL